jgi:hypothetical protein
VDFELDDEQLDLQRLVRDIAERECSPALVRAVVDGSVDGSGLSTPRWPGRPKPTATSPAST